MSRKKGVVEIAITVGLLAFAVSGCAINYWPKASDTPPPDGLDYVRAIHCGGLIWAQHVAYSEATVATWPGGRAKQYQRWAELSAWHAQQDPSLALRDMTALRDAFLLEAYKGSSASTWQNLRDAYPGELDSCHSVAEATESDIVIIGG